MSLYVEAGDVPLLDRITNAVRRGINHVLPWYDPGEDVERRSETERVRRQSMKARLQIEDIARRYARADRAVKR